MKPPSHGEAIRFGTVLLAAGLILGVVAWPMLSGRMYVHDDLGAMHIPFRMFYAHCLDSGLAFDWFPNMHCGFYLQGEGQAGLYHPLHRLLYGSLPFATAFNLEFLLSYPALFVGTFLLLRRWELGRDAAALGALIFTASGYNLFHYAHLHSVAVAAHLPWLLLGIDAAVRSPGRRVAGIGVLAVALLTASQLLLGHPQTILYCAMVEGPYALWLAWRQNRLRRLASLAWAKLLALLCGGIQILPTWDAARHSPRADPSLEFLAFGSLHPANLAQAVAPYLFRARVFDPEPTLYGGIPESDPIGTWRTGEFGLYVGMLVPVLIVWTLMRLRALGARRGLALAALALIVPALVLALGAYTPLFAVTSRLPIFRMFRVPARFVLLFHLAGAALAAIAFTDLADPRRASPDERLPWRRLWPLAIVPVLSLLVSSISRAIATQPGSAMSLNITSGSGIILSVALAVLAALLVALAARGHRSAMLGLLLFATADVASYGLTLVGRGLTLPPDAFLTNRKLPDGSTSSARIKQIAEDMTWTCVGTRLIDGTGSLRPARVLDYSKPTAWRVAAARWVRRNPPSLGWEDVPDPLPRARLVARAVPTDHPARDIESVDHQVAALVPQPIDLPQGPPGTAALIFDRPGEIGIVTDAPVRRLLVVAETYHEGWDAHVDGRPSSVLRVNGDFLGCVLEPGRHRVSLRFRPASLRQGKQLTNLGLSLTAITAVILLAPRRRLRRSETGLLGHRAEPFPGDPMGLGVRGLPIDESV